MRRRGSALDARVERANRPVRHPIVTADLEDIADRGLPLERFHGRTVLVSGASGFLAAYMVETLLFENEKLGVPSIKVMGLVRDAQRAATRYAHYGGRSDLRLLVQDVCDPIELGGPIDYVIHAASQASPRYFGADPVGTLSANVLGTDNLLRLASAMKVASFLFISSAEVYGQVAPRDIPISENVYGRVDPTAVRSCYAESKRMGETMCVAWLHQYGVRTKIVRPFHTYGPGMPLGDGRVFSDFVADLVSGRDIVIRGTGEALRTYCYLADAVAGFFRVLLDGTPGEAYNVGNSQTEVSVSDLAEMLAALFPEKKLRVAQREPATGTGYIESPVNRMAPDTRKLERLGWHARHSLESGFRRTVLSFS